jgi:hypothetical protein
MDKVRKPNISVCYKPSSEPYSIYSETGVGNCHRRRGNMQNYCPLYVGTNELDSLERSGNSHNTPTATYRIVYV